MDQQQQNLTQGENKQILQKCTFYNKKKNRKCNIEAYRPGYEFCVFHLPEQLKNYEYIDCPIDPSHQVLKSKLNRHLKICNKFKEQQRLEENPFFQLGINQQNPTIVKEKHTQRLQELFQNKSQFLQTFIETIPKFFDQAIQIYQSNQNCSLPTNESLSQYLQDEDDFEIKTAPSYNEKDLLQVDLLVQTLKDSKLLSNSYCYIEYGAGKGRLSHGIAQAVVQEFEGAKACHILIERDARRLKFDRFHRDNPYFLRLRMDITDFSLPTLRNQLPKSYFEKSNDIQYVGVCKHMCGGATDLTIRSLISSHTQQDRFTGLICATCCHHLCDRQTYVNTPFLIQLGMSEVQIDLLFACSSWGVSGQVQKKIKLEEVQGEDFFSLITSQTKCQVGKMAKRIIDIGRLLYITSTIPNVEGSIIKYCERQLSPENFLLSIVIKSNQI